MKKLLLSISLFLFMIAFANAQSYKIFYKNTTTEITGTTINIDSVLNGDFFQKVRCDTISVKNISGNTLKTRCARTEISVITGSENNFCWGSGCYPTTVNVSPLLQSPDIAPGAIDNTFVGDYTPQDNPGSTTIQYCYYDNANPNDKACFTIVYTASIATAIDDLQKSEGFISDAFPNPANSIVSIKYEMNEYSENGKIQIYDMLGSKIKEVMLNDKEGTAKINVSDMSAGIYFYTFAINDKVVSTKKMIVSSK